MFRSCSISLREGTSSTPAPAPSGPGVPSASAPDMLRARERPRSHRPEARHCVLGCCQTPAPSRGGAGRWAGAGAGQQLLLQSHATLHAAASPETLPRAGHLPVHCRQTQTVETDACIKPGPTGSLLVPVSSPGLVPRATVLCHTAALVPGTSAASGSSPLPAGCPPGHSRDCPQQCPRCGSQRDLAIHHKHLRAR